MADDKRDCIVINYTGRSGAGPLDAFSMAKALHDSGERIIPIISSWTENIDAWEKAGFEKVIKIETYTNRFNLMLNTLLFYVRYKKTIKAALKDYNVKMVYCPMVTFWTGMINRLIDCGRMIMVNHDPIPHSGQSIFEPTRIFDPFKKADIVIVHSKAYIDHVSKKYAHVEYLPLGEHNFYKTIENKKTIIEYDSSKVNFVFFGRIEKYKGLDILAKAYEQLCKKYSRAITLSVIGNGDFSPYADMFSGLDNVTVINRWIKDEEVESVFVGENLINVCPYKDATQSGVVLVAYDYGVPAIATKTGGLPEQVFDGKTGFLVEPNDVSDLANAMERYINDADLISRQQENISEYLESISWKKSAKKLLSMTDRVNCV